jgi:thiamine pyrophosphate-dependent acetolactate synthase large subunit-like protein
MKVYEAIAQALLAEHDGPVFGLMGDGNMSLWGALGREPRANMQSARNEAGAVAMADGYFRASGKLGIATVTCGPGLTQIGTSLMAAARNRSAIMVVTGEMPQGSKSKLQSMDQRRFVEACSTRFYSISKPDNIAEEIAEAFYVARLQRCPVVLNLPMDTQEQSFDWDFEYRTSTTFLPRGDAVASEEALAPIVDALMKAERPIIIAGRGARAAGAKDEIIALADRVGALLATSLQAKGLFAGHEYDIGIAGTYASAPSEHLFADADFVLGVGAELGYYTTEGGLLFPSAEVARIDIAPAPAELGILPGLYARGDARKTVASISAMLQKRQVQKEGYRTDATREILASPAETIESAGDGLDPRRLLQNLGASLPRKALITCGAGHFLGFMAMHLPLPDDADMQFSLQFGAVGQTLPVAFGVGATNSGRPHIVIEGDGSLMMNLQELDTVVRYKQQMVLIVWNDSGFGAEVHKLRAKGFEPSLGAWEISPDFVALGKAFGGDGVRLEKEDEIGDAVKKGLAKGGLFVIDARVSPTAVSDAYQKIHFGQPNRAPLLRAPALAS